MKRKDRTTRLGARLARKTAACFLATVGLWLAWLAAPPDIQPVWGERAAAGQAGEGLPLWQRVLLGESALLSGDWGARGRAGEETQSAAGGEPDDPEDHEQVALPNQEGIVEKDLSGAGGLSVGGAAMNNRTDKTLDVAALAAVPVALGLPAEGPQVLIMHTHGSEAYAPAGEDVYEESDTARTTDEHYNIIRVGDEVERIFTEMGLRVLHDRTLYDYPAYSGAYERSKGGVQGYLAQYPSIRVVLDIHRDALVGADGAIYKTVAQVDGEKVAQILLVVGTDDGGLDHPQWQKNLALAAEMQRRMDSLWPGVARPIALRSSRYNQQLTQGSLLVEVGTHGNTLQEALRGARLFARAAGQVLLEQMEEG